MKQLLVVVLLTSSLMLAQNAQPSPVPPVPEKTALQQKAEDDRAKAEEVAREKAAADKRAASQAAEKPQVSENPKPIKKAEEQEEMSRAMLELQQAGLTLNQAAAKAQAFLAPYIAQRDAADKKFKDTFSRIQKSHDAEGCDMGIDKKWIKSDTCHPKED